MQWTAPRSISSFWRRRQNGSERKQNLLLARSTSLLSALFSVSAQIWCRALQITRGLRGSGELTRLLPSALMEWVTGKRWMTLDAQSGFEIEKHLCSETCEQVLSFYVQSSLCGFDVSWSVDLHASPPCLRYILYVHWYSLLICMSL